MAVYDMCIFALISCQSICIKSKYISISSEELQARSGIGDGVCVCACVCVLKADVGHSGTTVAPMAAHTVCLEMYAKLWSLDLTLWPLKASERASVRTNLKSKEGLFLVENDLLLPMSRGHGGRLSSNHSPWGRWPGSDPSKKGSGRPVHDLPKGCLYPVCALHHTWSSRSLPVTFSKYLLI